MILLTLYMTYVDPVAIVFDTVCPTFTQLLSLSPTPNRLLLSLLALRLRTQATQGALKTVQDVFRVTVADGFGVTVANGVRVTVTITELVTIVVRTRVTVTVADLVTVVVGAWVTVAFVSTDGTDGVAIIVGSYHGKRE
jgi:hypothetical protein